MEPLRHYKWAFRLGWFMLFAAGAVVALIFFGRGPDGQFHLVYWAGLLDDTGLHKHVAHFLLWFLALAFIGVCFAVTVGVVCRKVPARCLQCGGAAYWEGGERVAYVCRKCGHRHITDIDWGEK
ncbi:MAG TPA: hypothetical protein VKE94_21030 [Gemmataceae bacterium]|nr:hypothetical protein [Gemmataceae bacterium]